MAGAYRNTCICRCRFKLLTEFWCKDPTDFDHMYPSVHLCVSNAHTTSAGTSSRTGPETSITSVTSAIYSCLIRNSQIFFLSTQKQQPEGEALGKKACLYFSAFYLISASVININIQHSSWKHGDASRKPFGFSFLLLEAQGTVSQAKVNTSKHVPTLRGAEFSHTFYLSHVAHETSSPKCTVTNHCEQFTPLTPLPRSLRGKQEYTFTLICRWIQLLRLLPLTEGHWVLPKIKWTYCTQISNSDQIEGCHRQQSS